MSGPNGDPDLSIEEDDDEEDEFSVEEYAAINSMLDQINSCLDDLEERNDSLNGKLHELLAANRQVRHDMRAQQSAPASGSTEEEKQLEDKQLEDNKLEDNLLEDKQLEDKQLEDKQLEDKSSPEKEQEGESGGRVGR